MKKFSLPKDGGLIEAGLPNGIKHTYERIPAHIYEDEEAASERLAEKIVAAINSCEGVYRLGLQLLFTGLLPAGMKPVRSLSRMWRSTASMSIILLLQTIRAATADFTAS